MYQVSNEGRVKSLPRIVDNGYVKRNIKEKILRFGTSRDYLIVVLCDNTERKTFYVHRLVAEHFIPNPNNLLEVNHKNEDKTLNTVDNLEWCDRTYNVRYGSRTNKAAQANTNGKCSKPVIQLSLDDEYIAEYPSVKEANRQFGFNVSNICSCCKGLRNNANGFKWKYKETI